MLLVIRAKDNPQTVLAAANHDSGDVIILEDNWYFAPDAVHRAHLKKTSRTYHCPYKGTAFWYDLDLPGLTVRNIAWVYDNAKPDYAHLDGYIAFYPRETAGTIASEEDSASA